MPVLWFYVCIQLLVHAARGQRGTGSQTGLSKRLGTEQTASQFDQSRNVFILPLKPQSLQQRYGGLQRSA
jgi:hypothetical protein